MPDQNLVPRRPMTIEEMEEIARGAGWRVEADPAESDMDEDVSEHRWRVDKQTTITLVRSVALEWPYLVVSGPNPDEVIAVLSPLVPTFTVADILERLATAESTPEKVEALHLLAAIGLRHHRDDVYRPLVTYMDDPNARVRVAALYAAFQLNWKQLRPHVQNMRESDEDSDLRVLSSNLVKLTDWSAG